MKKILILLLTVALVLPAQAQNKRYHGDGIDDYLRFAPLAAAVTLKASGVKSASSWKRFGINAAASIILSAGTSYALKHTIHDTRPDGTDNHAFPSGHATIAFAGATILHKEYWHTSPWISIAGYSVATLTAVDRVRRNRHHWEDVAVGAAIGILGTEAGYWLGDLITGEKSRYTVSVSPEGVSLAINL